MAEKHAYHSDQERYEHCRKYALSGLSLSEYARKNGLNRNTFRDWVSAYRNINGRFINVSEASESESEIVGGDVFRANILSEAEKAKKCNHFSRFDHSIVVIEFKGVKVTTSLEQAERILGNLLS